MTIISSLRDRVEIDDVLDFEGDAVIRVDQDAGDSFIFYLSEGGRREMREALAKLDSETSSKAVAPSPTGFNESAVNLAIQHERQISFQYQKASANVIEHRDLLPTQVIESRGDHKIVVGYDPAREEPRAFRLDRILGSVTISG